MRKDTLAPGGERREGTRNLVPSSQVWLKLETGVSGGIIALAVPE